MTVYKIENGKLTGKDGKVIAYISDKAILNSLGRKIGSINGNKVLDSNGNTIVIVKGSDIYDPENVKQGNLDEASGLIDVSHSDFITLAAFWFLFFVD